MEDFNFEASEKKAGAKAARIITSAVRSTVSSHFERRSGEMEKSRASARYKVGHLDRLVLFSPHYSFKSHFGSTKPGATKANHRKDANVRSFERHYKGKLQTVAAHHRSGGAVAAHVKGIDYKSTNHIAEALNATNALEQLATDLGVNRIVKITSQIDIKISQS